MKLELESLKVGTILENVSLKDYTTYKLNTIASFMVFPNDLKGLLNLLDYLKLKKIPFKIIGGGSNLIFKDSKYEGVLINLKSFDKLEITDNQIRVGAGYNLMKLALKVSKMGLTGLEFATGIPGTVGGAIFNNSGAYKSDMGYIVQDITVLTPNLEIKTLTNKEANFHYRTSFFKENRGYTILECRIMLKKGDKDIIDEIITDRKKRRIESQPLEYPSAGSVFRNPPDIPAGKLIEDSGLKGFNINDAYVSDKHANFIVNKGSATGEDIVKLIDKIKDTVFSKYNIELILEQEIV